MSSAMISEHLPDIDLITSYAERPGTPFSSASPWTKLVLLILVVVIVTITRDPVILAILYGIILLCCRYAGLPLRKIFAWYALPAIFVLSLVGILAWSQPGTTVLSIGYGAGTLRLTDQGIILVGVLLLKALISVTYTLFFLMTTRYGHFSGMISRIFPDPLDQIFLLAYRFVFLTLAMAGSLLKAVRSRGGGIIRSIRMQGQIFAGVFGLIFIRSFDQAERVQKAMAARGYNGTYSATTEIPRPAMAEYLVLGAAVVTACAIVALTPNPWGW